MRSTRRRTLALDLAGLRRAAQRLVGAGFASPAAAVSSLGAVQAQDYAGALWGIGQRTRAVTERDVERALAERAIVRTWLPRGTLHVAAAADVRWMLALVLPQVLARRRARWRELALGERDFGRAREILAKRLAGGRQLSRAAMYQALADGGVPPAGQRGVHVLSRLAHEGLLCFAAREGKQHAFTLLDGWVPPARSLTRDEALAELAGRYFTGHGPATLRDFAWWSGLTMPQARAALELARPRLAQARLGPETYWFSGDGPARARSPSTVLLPAFDDYLVAYRDRSAALEPAHEREVNHLLSPTVVEDGRVVGTWTRTLERRGVRLRMRFFDRSSRPAPVALEAAAMRYGAFVGRPLVPP